MSLSDDDSSRTTTPVNFTNVINDDNQDDLTEISASRLLAYRAPWATPPQAAVECSSSLFSPTLSLCQHNFRLASGGATLSPPDSLSTGHSVNFLGSAGESVIWDSSRLACPAENRNSLACFLSYPFVYLARATTPTTWQC